MVERDGGIRKAGSFRVEALPGESVENKGVCSIENSPLFAEEEILEFIRKRIYRSLSL
ncbi:MAG: hypothetical protein JRC60_05105 [Deltaproteobacteria bacterium]|nr:hypothetical protein [Deltaproteobacteria bacterium]